MRPALPASALLGFCLLAAYPAQAAPITLDYLGLTGSKSGAITLSGSNRSVNAGTINFEYWGGGYPGFAAGLLDAFCIEPATTLRTAPTAYQINAGLGGFGTAQQSLIAGLYDFHYAPAVSNAAAFQLVLWEIVTDGGSGPLALNTGGFAVASGFGTALQTARTWIDELNGWFAGLDDPLASPYRSGRYEFFALTSPNSQNELTVRSLPVPEPGVLALLGIGAVAGSLARRRRS